MKRDRLNKYERGIVSTAMKYTLLGLLFLFTLSGCADVPHGEVAGMVTLDGKPLDSVLLSFMAEPVTETKAPYTTALTDDAGRYRLSTIEGREGAVVGSYCVIMKDFGGNRLPKKYQFANQTPYTGVRVEVGGNELNFELVREPGSGRRAGR